MAPAILSYFGFGTSTPAAEEDKSPIRALPASWYTSRNMYDLERRAIFSRRWLLVTHKLRLNQSGEWVRFSLAGFAFILCRDRDGTINGFHNVCRHRAYPVVEGAESGVSKIFACRYHGWSYGLNGKLAKAPGYQELDGFDKSKNSLFPIHVHIDQNGFIWVNFDAKQKPELAWEDDYDAVEQQEKFDEIDFDDYVFDHTWEQKGDFNWKMLADNYNKSYHASTIDSEEPEPAGSTSSAHIEDGSIQHDFTTNEQQKATDLTVSSTYHFPNTSMNVSPHLFFIQRFEPDTPTSTFLRYEVYRNKLSPLETFQALNQSHKRVLCTDRIRYDAAQRGIDATKTTTITNITADVDADAETEEDTDLYFQELFRGEITSHHKREEKAKREIWPARQEVPVVGNGGVSKEDVEFCEGLACGTGRVEKIAW